MAAFPRLESQQQRQQRTLDVANTLRGIDLSVSNPKTLDELWSVFTPLRNQIPELERYSLAIPEGRREFPRTATGLTILGGVLRASDALEVLGKPAAVEKRQEASQSLLREFEMFTGPQDRESRLSYDQFIAIVELFRPYAGSADAVSTIAVALTYGDLCKMPEVQRIVHERIGHEATDHDAALRAAFDPCNFVKLSDLFPTIHTLPPECQARIHAEVLYGPHLGHILECLTCAATLVPFREHTAGDRDALNFWLLPTLLDIFAARADQARPETWTGSVLGNSNLVPAMLAFAEHLPRLHTQGALAFFDGFQEELARRSFYQPIFSDSGLSAEEKHTVFRLSRYLAWETDHRDIETLLAVFKSRLKEEKESLNAFFMNDGFDRERPKAIITYLPYVFSQLYAKHLPLAEATDKAITTLCTLLRRIEECELYTLADTRAGFREYTGQNVWFRDLRSLPAEKLRDAALRLSVAVKDGRPEVVLESAVLSKHEEMRRMFLSSLEEATRRAMPECEELLLPQLTDFEKEVYSFVRSHNFVDGAWYRPIHNVVVPCAMIAIVERTGASRDLVLAAMLHDIGYAGLKIPGTLQGAAWDAKDVRESHMAAGAEMSRRFLEEKQASGALAISPERIEKLVQIIATHDDPYIGKPLTEHEALLHRDADRAFVISTVSFWKDYIAYLSDKKHIKKFAEEGITLTPEAFLRLRQGSFESDDANEMARFTSFEPMTSEWGKAICDGQRARRQDEIRDVEASLRVAAGLQEQLIELLRARIVDDLRAVLFGQNGLS